MTPAQRSLTKLRREGYEIVEVVEKWIPQARKRRDFAGIIDIICIGNGETVGVQTTSASNLASRVQKIEESDALPVLRKVGWRILCHGWRKNAAGRWICREVDVS